MQPESSNTKKILIAVVLIALVAFSVWFFLKKPEVEVIFDEFGNQITSEIIGKDLIDLLDQLQAVKLDSGVFKTVGFLNLTDYSVDLVDQPQGRVNPFERLGGTQTR
jgi:hypothetical protein